MSIHKSQGQTLERVKVDLGKVFEKGKCFLSRLFQLVQSFIDTGQAYVALSRATSLAGLQILNFDPSKVNAHPKVKEWSQTLEIIRCEETGEEDVSWTL
ncbi:hypothetical protein L218DRAFT_953725 [Marasmius fiardii PR-910]|nr:hypothetical protein L218DRAFT_953725 [Marasmius fiardii PR-910]